MLLASLVALEICRAHIAGDVASAPELMAMIGLECGEGQVAFRADRGVLIKRWNSASVRHSWTRDRRDRGWRYRRLKKEARLDEGTGERSTNARRGLYWCCSGKKEKTKVRGRCLDIRR
jgi:hypothetical protein